MAGRRPLWDHADVPPRTALEQLASPPGWPAPIVALVLNRLNLPLIAGCAAALRLGRGDRAADLGFGGGRSLRFLLDAVGPEGQVTGIEPSSAMLRYARRRYPSHLERAGLRILEGTAGDLPLRDASQDGLMSANTVYFWRDIDAGLREIHRVLADRGRLAIGISESDEQLRMGFAREGYLVIRPEELVERVRGAGFRDVRLGRRESGRQGAIISARRGARD